MKQSDERVLYYGLSDEKQEALLLSLLADLGVRARQVRQSDLKKTVENLAGYNAVDAFSGDEAIEVSTAPADSILVMAGLSDTRINELLTGIRQTAGLSIALKAVLTEHNRSWTFAALAAELRQEHALMQLFMALQQVVRQAEQQLNKPGQAVDRQRIQDAVRRAQQVLTAAQQGDVDSEKMTALGREIAGLLD